MGLYLYWPALGEGMTLDNEATDEMVAEIMEKMQTVPNWKIRAILIWAEDNRINLDRATIDFDYEIWVPNHEKHQTSICFDHGVEKESHDGAENFRHLKRAIGNFPETEDGKQAELVKLIEVERLGMVRIQWYGAYTCKATSYECTFDKFHEEGE